MEAVRDFLKAVGFSDAASSVYVTLLEEGPMTSREIELDLASSKSRGWVLSVIQELVKRGAILDSHGGKGKGGEAKLHEIQNPEVLFDTIIADLKDRQKQATAQSTEAWEFRNVGAKRPQDLAIHGEVGLRAAILGQLKTVKTRFLIVDPHLKWVNSGVIEDLKANIVSGIDVRIVTQHGSTAKKGQIVKSGIDARFAQTFPVTFVVADDTVITFQASQISATISKNPGLATLLASAFEEAHKVGSKGAPN